MFQTASTIEKIETRSDNTIKITIGTQEIMPEQATELFNLKQKLGFFLFDDKPIKPDDLNIPDFVPEIKGDKTPSQRLRAVKYVHFTKSGNKKEDFDNWYKQQCEREIEMWKERINEL